MLYKISGLLSKVRLGRHYWRYLCNFIFVLQLINNEDKMTEVALIASSRKHLRVIDDREWRYTGCLSTCHGTLTRGIELLQHDSV